MTKLVWDRDTGYGEHDERWADMYACITPYMIDFDDQPVEFIKICMYVWYKGGFYWAEQHLEKEDLDLVAFDLMKRLLNEMVVSMDEYLDTGIKKENP